MQIKKDRNYWLAFFACLSLTVMALMGGVDNWKWYLLSNINVAIFLFVAWLFDDK